MTLTFYFLHFRKVKYTRNVFGHHQTAQCLMVNLHHHTGQVQQVCSVAGILGTGQVGAVVPHGLCDVTVCQVVLFHHGAPRPRAPQLLLYPQAHVVCLLSQTQVVVVLLQTWPWSHVTLNRTVYRHRLHPSMEPSDHRVATTGRPHPPGAVCFCGPVTSKNEDKLSDDVLCLSVASFNFDSPIIMWMLSKINICILFWKQSQMCQLLMLIMKLSVSEQNSCYYLQYEHSAT